MSKYAIFQLGEGREELRDKSYRRYDKDNLPVNTDYECVYVSDTFNGKVNLESIFSKFNNGLQPSNYYGHSLSVSDVIVVKENENDNYSAYYCDSFGFEKLNDDFLSKDVVEKLNYNIDVRNEYEAIKDNTEMLNRKNYIENNYSDIFELADKRGVILDYQDELKFIYEVEKDLPFPSIAEYNGVYWFEDRDMVNDLSAEERIDKIIDLYVPYKYSEMTEYERNEFVNNYEREDRNKIDKGLYEYLIERKEYEDFRESLKFENQEQEVVYDTYSDNIDKLERLYDYDYLFETITKDVVLNENQKTNLKDKLIDFATSRIYEIVKELDFYNWQDNSEIGEEKELLFNHIKENKLDDYYREFSNFNNGDGNSYEYNELMVFFESQMNKTVIKLEDKIGTVEAELLEEGEFGFTDEELEKIIYGINNVHIENAGIHIYLNELDSRFVDNSHIFLGDDVIEYNTDRECYALYRGSDPEAEIDYYTYFNIEDIKSIYIGDDEIRNYYSDYEKYQIRKNNGITDVAIESTDDYTDENFHQSLADINIQNEDGSYGKVTNLYRVVTIGSDGRIKPLNDKVYSSSQEARASIDNTKFYEANYDDMVHNAGKEIAKYNAELERMNKIIDKYVEKGFEFANREDYSDKYIKNLSNALDKAEKEGYSDNVIVEYAKAKTRYIDVEKAIKSIPLIKNAELIEKIDGIEFYIKKDSPNSIFTYDNEFAYNSSVDLKTACKNIFQEHYEDISIYAGIMQDDIERRRRFEDEEILNAIYKEAGIIDFRDLDKKDFVILDTETTGFNKDDEIVELGILNKQGNTIYESIFKPFKEMSEEARKVNGISDEELNNAPSYISQLEKIVDVLEDKNVVIFNKAFDTRMILQTAEIHKAEFENQEKYNELIFKLNKVFNDNTYCAMQSYAKFINSYKVIGLNNALKENGIEVIQSHRAIDDCKDTLKLINKCIDKEREKLMDSIKITPIKEFIKDGIIYTGDEISGFHIDRNVGMGFADRSRVYNAVLEFQNANKDFPNLPRAIDEDGSYMDKDILYSVYDDYIAISHKEELQPYEKYFENTVDFLMEYNRENNISYLGSTDRYMLKVNFLAEIYYAKMNGLNEEQIDYMIESATRTREPNHFIAYDMRNIWKAFQSGLTKEQIEIVNDKDIGSSEREIFLDFMREGGTVEQIETLKGFDFNVLYPMKYGYTNNIISDEQGKAICENLKTYLDNGLCKNQWELGMFAESIIHNLRNEPKSAIVIDNTFKEFFNQKEETNFFDFVEKKGWIEVMENKDEVKMEETKNPHGEEVYKPSDEKLTEDEMKKEAILKGVGAVMNSSEFANYTKTMNKLMYNNYSARNCGLIMEQYLARYCKENNIDVLKLSLDDMTKVIGEALKSDKVPTYLMGYEAWKDYGRQVSGKDIAYSIVAPNYVNEYNGKGTILKAIEKKFREDFAKDPNKDYSEFTLGKTGLTFRSYGQKGNNLIDVCMNGKTILGKQSVEDIRKFLNDNVIGKMPNGYSVTYVYDVKNTVVPEHLWVKNNFKKSELELNDKGEPITRKPYKNSNVLEYKIKNTEERKAKFNPNLSMEVKGLNEEKAEILFDVLKTVSQNKNVPMTVEKIEGEARGFYHIEQKRIAISDNLDNISRCATAIHEMAHADLHALPNSKDRATKEVEAEAVSYMTSQHFGISTDIKSFNYLAGWSSGRDLKELESSMSTILNESKKLEREIEKELNKRGYDLNIEPIKASNDKKIEVAIEGENDYDVYKIVKLNDKGEIEPINDEVFGSSKEAKASIDNEIYVEVGINNLWEKSRAIKNEIKEKEEVENLKSNELEVAKLKDKLANTIKDYKEFIVTEKNDIGELKATTKDLLLNTTDDMSKDILKELIDNLNKQNRKVVALDKNLNLLEKAEDVSEIQKLTEKIEKNFSASMELKTEFSQLSYEYTNRVQELKAYAKASLREQFNIDPIKVIKEYIDKSDNETFKKLGDKEISYIAKSDYLSQTNYSLLKNNDLKGYIEKGMERLSIIDDIKSKNGQFVEIVYCEQWFDKPIVEGGALIHPATANKLFSEAEKDINILKKQAEKNDDYIPYSKCRFSLFTETKDTLICTSSRMDVGDGFQKDLTSFIKADLNDKTVLEAYGKSVRERVKDKIYEPSSNSSKSISNEQTIAETNDSKKFLSSDELKGYVSNSNREDISTDKSKEKVHDRGSMVK